MDKKIVENIKKQIIPLVLIVVSVLVFYWTRDYKQVPSGIGPAFFPRLIAGGTLVLSVLCIITHWNREEVGEFTPKTGANSKILLTTLMLAALVLLMQYVNAILGILVFLIGYLRFLSGESWKGSVVIGVLGTALMFGIISALRIPL